jgi:mannose-6-phosphate isomerase-like protein (cupin superfamily)
MAVVTSIDGHHHNGKRTRVKTMRYARLTRCLLLALGMMLSSQGLAGEAGFTVSRLEDVRSFQSHDGFGLALLAQTPAVNIRLNRLEDRIRRHTHPQTDHFLYLIRGQIELTAGQETRIINTGDFVTIPRNIAHSMRRLGASEALFLDVASPPDVGDVIWHE